MTNRTEEVKRTVVGIPVGKIALAWLSLSFLTVYEAVGVVVLWRWFAVPVFDVPSISIWQVLGLRLMLWIIFNDEQEIHKDETRLTGVEYFVSRFAVTTWALVLGYLVFQLS